MTWITPSSSNILTIKLKVCLANLGYLHFFLGKEFKSDASGVYLKVVIYIKYLLRNFGMKHYYGKHVSHWLENEYYHIGSTIMR